MKIEKIRMAKRVLADGGVNVYQKDIKDVIEHKFNMESPDGEVFPHRYIYRIEMKNGTIYEVLRETVDKNGKFSLESARFKTQSVTQK